MIQVRPTTFTTLNISEAKIGNVIRHGIEYRVEGYTEDGFCPVDVCNAVCCRVATLKGVVGKGPCEFLNLGNNLCKLHELGGSHCKPVSCLVWPTSPESIEKTNDLAERFGMPWRCQLKMVEVTHGNCK